MRRSAPIYSVKRLMGRGVADVQDELKLFPFRIAADSEAVIRVQLGEKTSRRPKSRAFILRQLQKERRGASGRARLKGRHHRARLFQRRAAPGDQGCGQNRRFGRAALGNEPPRLRSRTVWTSGSRASSRSMIWAAAPSISRSSSFMTASSKSWPPTAIRTWAATISTTGSSVSGSRICSPNGGRIFPATERPCSSCVAP